jgi:hypothetical protein
MFHRLKEVKEKGSIILTVVLFTAFVLSIATNSLVSTNAANKKQFSQRIHETLERINKTALNRADYALNSGSAKVEVVGASLGHLSYLRIPEDPKDAPTEASPSVHIAEDYTGENDPVLERSMYKWWIDSSLNGSNMLANHPITVHVFSCYLPVTRDLADIATCGSSAEDSSLSVTQDYYPFLVKNEVDAGDGYVTYTIAPSTALSFGLYATNSLTLKDSTAKNTDIAAGSKIELKPTITENNSSYILLSSEDAIDTCSVNSSPCIPVQRLPLSHELDTAVFANEGTTTPDNLELNTTIPAFEDNDESHTTFVQDLIIKAGAGVTGSGHADIYVRGNLTIDASPTSATANLNIYVLGGQVSIAGGQTYNNLFIYAPNATCQSTGSGDINYEGALACKNIDMQGLTFTRGEYQKQGDTIIRGSTDTKYEHMIFLPLKEEKHFNE